MRVLKRKLRTLRRLPVEKVIKIILNKAFDAPYYKLRKQLIKNHPIKITPIPFESFESSSKFFFDEKEKNILISKLKEQNLETYIIDDANKICSHIFNFLGSGDKYLGEKLPWNMDFKTNFVWENHFYKDIKVVDLSNNADVKVPWELSRFQHLFTLGKAYWLTSDEKYAIEFREEIIDWIEKNPVEMSVNWTCTMDVGIRAVNLIAAYYFFKNSPSINKEFWIKFNSSLYQHGRFIMKNLENKGNHTGNHYLSNIVGLAWLGIYFGSFTVNDKNKRNNPNKWLKFAMKELEKEMFVQNNPDGTNYEASTSYHRLVTELFLLTTLYCNKNGVFFTKEYMTRLEKMCEFIMNITKPNGLSPIIGDADDGRLLILSNYSSWVRNDYRHLLGIAGELYDRDDFRFYGKSHEEDTLWTYKNYTSNVKKPRPITSTAYKDGGYYILRNDRIYCCIRCGELSFRGEGVHSHNDQLSFELNVDGEDFIVDPGSYVYTSDFKMRNQFRNTAMHNIVQLDKLEQNNFNEYELFLMREQTKSKCINFGSNSFEGEHYGFQDKNNVIHNRTIKINDHTLSVTDLLKHYNDSMLATAILHLAPDVKCSVEGSTVLLTKTGVTTTVEITNFYEVKMEASYYSESYGSIKPTNKLLFLFEETNNKNKLVFNVK